jgi:hypothetical protein
MVDCGTYLSKIRCCCTDGGGEPLERTGYHLGFPDLREVGPPVHIASQRVPDGVARRARRAATGPP